MKLRLLIATALIVASMAFAAPSYGSLSSSFLNSYTSGTNAQVMEDVLSHYCRSTNPVNCGVYQHEIEQAKIRANQLLGLLSTYSRSQQQAMLDNLLLKIKAAFYTARDTNSKVVLAYYHKYFTQGPGQTSGSDDLFSYLFDNGNTIRDYRTTDDRFGNDYDDYDYDDYYPRYDRNQSTYGSIQNIWSLGSATRVDTARKRILLRGSNSTLTVGIRARAGNRIARPDDGYRVVATLHRSGNTYGGDYNRDGSWDFELGGASVRNASYITFSLLCSRCDTGRSFQGRGFNNWNVIDSVRYGLQKDYSRYNRYDDRYDNYNRRPDLGVAGLEYRYNFSRDELDVELVTTIRNYSNYAVGFDNLVYDVEVEGYRISSRDYNVVHQDTDCDKTNVSSSRYTNFDIRGNDECEITVDIRFDRGVVEYRDDVEIEVTLRSSEDNRSSNNSDTISFRVDR